MTHPVVGSTGEPPVQTVARPIISTICRDCVFAEWNGNEQTGCVFDLLDRFEENGAEIAGIDDNNVKYFSIIGRFCKLCHNKDALRDVPAKDWQNFVLDKVRNRFEVVIYVDHTTTEEWLTRTIKSVIDQESCKVDYLTIGLNDSQENQVTPNFAVASLRLALAKAKRTETRWQVKKIVSPYEDGRPATYEHAIDETLVGSKSTFYVACKAGHEFRPDYLRTIDDAVNLKLMRFVALRGEPRLMDGEPLVVMTKLHQFIKGNAGLPILEKIDEIASEEATAHMVKTYGDLLV